MYYWVEKFIEEHKESVHMHTGEYIDHNDIDDMQYSCDMVFGPELRHYLLTYGYLECGSVKLAGTEKSFGEINSDMAKLTKVLNGISDGRTDGFAVIEHVGNTWTLVGSNDMIYTYELNTDIIKGLGVDVEDWMPSVLVQGLLYQK